MCGIVGTLSFENGKFTVAEQYIARMRDTMVHRGPDGSGVWVSKDGRIGFGHRRLSIVDLSNEASQPMCNEDMSLWITYNGEIYNHMEIRNELLNCGAHEWKTDHSDTEVILHAFEEWGIDCIHRFRGMFAFALWDDKRKELWLVRDRIGIKPLYYSIHHNRIVFASEIKAILQDPDQKRAINDEAFYHFLSFLTTPAPQTLFDGIQKVPAGTWIRINAIGDIREKAYWDVWDYTIPLNDASEEDIAAFLIEELRNSVRLRKVSDVPLGVFLSGGIDSSINTALFSEGESSPVKTFTIGYHRSFGTYENETIFAKMVADKIGADYHERLLTVYDLIDFLPLMISLQDEPIADPVCFPLFYVSKLARETGAIVCQTGEGSDELFCGYPSWKKAIAFQQLSEWFHCNSLKCLGLQIMKNIPVTKDRIPIEWLRRTCGGIPIFWSGAEAFTEVHKTDLLSHRLRKRFAYFSSWECLKSIRQRFETTACETSILNWMSYIDLKLRLPELLLMRVDKMSMGVGLECRVPFLDHKFVALSMSIPAKIKLKGGRLKHILKEAVRGLVPNTIIERNKQGFGVPTYEWLFQKTGEPILRELLFCCDETGLFNRNEVSHLFAQARGPQVWYLSNFALWWKHYILQEPLNNLLTQLHRP